MRRNFFWIICVLLSACQSGPGERADLILYNAVVSTLNEEFPVAEAVSIRGDKILAVGTEEEMMSYRGDSTVVIDLQGKFVMPGFIEGHVTFFRFGQQFAEFEFSSIQILGRNRGYGAG